MMKQPARPPHHLDAPEGTPHDFDWPPASDSAEACEIVVIDDDQHPKSQGIVIPSHPVRRAEPPRPPSPRVRRAGPGEELVWPPPSEEIEAFETIEVGSSPADAPTIIVPTPRPRPRSPKIEAVFERSTPRVRAPSHQGAVRPTEARPTPTRTTPVRLAPPTARPVDISRLGQRPSVALQALVIGIAVVAAAGIGIWLVGRVTPAPFDPVGPSVAAPMHFRIAARPVTTADPIALSEAWATRPASGPPTAPLVTREQELPAPIEVVETPADLPFAETEEPLAPAVFAPPVDPGATGRPSTGFDPAQLPGERLNLPSPPPPPPVRPRTNRE